MRHIFPAFLIFALLLSYFGENSFFQLQQSHAAGAPMVMQTGYYMGTGAAQSITGLGFTPTAVIIKADTTAGAAVLKTASMPTPNTAFFSATADDVTSQVTLQSGGFSLGTNVAVNAINVRYTYVALNGSDCSVDGEFCSGFYIGDGTASKKIVTGFQPDLIWVKRSGTSATWRSSAMPANVGQFFDATNQNVAGALFSTIDADGFNVGSTNNANLGVYYYTAWKGSASKVAVGTYTGNAADNRNITGLPFAPQFVAVKNANAAVAVTGVYTSLDSYGDNSSQFTATVVTPNNIQELQSNGFQVGSASNVNGNANLLYWMAFAGASENTGSGTFRMASGSYTGTGVAASITGLGFAPDLVIIKHTDQATDQHAVFRTRLMLGDTTAFLANGAVHFTGGITALSADGFTRGTNATVNTAGDTYYWTAFGNAWRPNTRSGAADFTIGAYTGNGLDNRNITGLPFTPDLVTIKQNAATVGMLRTSAQVGDFSIFFSGAAGVANAIQAFSANAFQLGNSANINTAAGTHHWFAFKSGLNLSIGNYTGTGIAFDVTTPTFSPQALWIKAPAGVTSAVMRTAQSVGNQALPFTNAAQILNAITGFLANGFSVGTAAETNANSVLFTYIAWRIPDITPPTGSIVYADPDAIVRQNDSLVLTATFSEPVADSPVPAITLSGANSVSNAAMTKVSPTEYMYTHTVGSGDGVTSVSFTAGNDLSLNPITAIPTAGASFTVDNTAPSNQDTVLAASTSVLPGAPVTIVSSGDINHQVWLAPAGSGTFLAGPTMTQAVNGTATTINAPTTPGTYRLFLIDIAGNISAGSNAIITVDTTAPTPVLSSSVVTPSKLPVLPLTVTWDEPVTGFTDADLTIINGVVSNFAGSGDTYTFDLTPTADGTVSVDIAAAIATDIAGNNSNAAVQWSIVSDQTAPLTPVSLPAAGTYASSQIVSFSSSGSTDILYTTDGSLPSCLAGSVYSTPLTISSTTTLKVIGCDAADNSSPFGTFTYILTTPPAPSGGGGGGGGGGGIPPIASASVDTSSADTATPEVPGTALRPVAQEEETSLVEQAVFTDIETHWSREAVRTLQGSCNIQGYRSETGKLLHTFQPEAPVTRAELAQMLAQCLEVTPSEVTKKPFPDVGMSAWFASAVDFGKQNGYIHGTPEGFFYPNRTTNRAEGLAMILRAQFGDDEVQSGSIPFDDVPADSWFARYVSFAVARNFVGGYIDAQGQPTGLFGPVDQITRGQAAKIIVNVLGL